MCSQRYDALQSEALNAVVTANMPADETVAILHMDDNYGQGVADNFANIYEESNNTLCAQLEYYQGELAEPEPEPQIAAPEATAPVQEQQAQPVQREVQPTEEPQQACRGRCTPSLELVGGSWR